MPAMKSTSASVYGNRPSPGGVAWRPCAGARAHAAAAVRSVDGEALVFGHGHALRALTARWLGEPIAAGRLYRLDTATVSQLGYERDQAVIEAWNVPA